MDEIREAALAYYANLSEQEKKLAFNFFKAMDKDGNGTVSVLEYIKFLKKRKVAATENLNFFKELDKDGNGSLDFDEVITLFYIIESGRYIVCGGCGLFLKGVYFTCVGCFTSDSSDAFNICCSCYRHRNFKHHDDAVFCDNFALAQCKKKKNQSEQSSFMENLEKAANVLSSLANLGAEIAILSLFGG